MRSEAGPAGGNAGVGIGCGGEPCLAVAHLVLRPAAPAGEERKGQSALLSLPAQPRRGLC